MPIPTAKPISEPMPMLMFVLMFMLIGYACANGNVSAYVFIVFLMCIQSFFMRER